MDDSLLVTFGAYVSYGKMDSVDYEVDIELTKEEYERLKVSCKNHWRMRDDDAVADIYSRAYQAALDIDLDVMRSDEDMLAERMAWYLGITEEEARENEYTDEEIIAMLESEGDRGITYPDGIEEECYRYEDEDDIED